MKIRRLKIHDIDYKPLMKGVDLFFPKSDDDFIHANCLIGINGSGKSQILELLAEIFLFLDALFRLENKKEKEVSPFAFKIEYEVTINKVKHLVIIECDKIGTKKKDIFIDILKDNDSSYVFDILEFKSFLPQKVIGYTSGDNETLSLPFDLYYDEYAKYTGERALKKEFKNAKDYEPMLYFMNYNTNLGIAISSLIFEDNIETISVLKKELRIKNLVSFKITIQTNQPNAPFYNHKGDGGIKLTKELEIWKEKLIKCCPKAVQDESDIKHKRWILEYNLDDKNIIKLFKYHFNSALELYTALYKFELLNNLIIKDDIVRKIKTDRKERRLVTRMPMVPEEDKVLRYSELKLRLTNDNVLDYLSLSDGEHQFLNVFGTVLMIDLDNSLFLLDEPETHFNPTWRRTFISILKQITKGRKQDMFITSHSPFVISDSKNENVFIFTRNADKILITEPTQETYGASFDEILKMAFDIKIPISEDSLSLIKELENSDDVDYIEKRIKELGESYELTSLHRKIEFLKSIQN